MISFRENSPVRNPAELSESINTEAPLVKLTLAPSLEALFRGFPTQTLEIFGYCLPNKLKEIYLTLVHTDPKPTHFSQLLKKESVSDAKGTDHRRSLDLLIFRINKAFKEKQIPIKAVAAVDFGYYLEYPGSEKIWWVTLTARERKILQIILLSQQPVEVINLYRLIEPIRVDNIILERNVMELAVSRLNKKLKALHPDLKILRKNHRYFPSQLPGDVLDSIRQDLQTAFSY